MTPEELTPLFEARLGSAVASVSRAAVGNGQESWFVEVTDGRKFVLRRTAVGGTLEWTDRKAEFEVLRGLAGTGLPVPTVHWFEPEGGSLGRAYFVMDRLPGRPLGTGSPDINDGVARDLGRWLARLHSSVPANGDTAAATLAELDATRARYAELSPRPIFDALIEWLGAHVPADGAAAVRLWGDAGAHNILVEGPRVTALLDWELTRIGHPLDDLGAAVWSCLGILDVSLVVEGYEAELGRGVDRDVLRWFEVLAHVSRSIMTLCGTRAFHEHRNLEPNLAGLGRALVNTSLLRAARAAWGLAPNPATRQDAPLDVELEAISAFLTRAVAPGLTDRRLISGVKIAAALLQLDRSDASEPAALGDRQALVDALGRERALLRPLLDLYGPTTKLEGE